MSAGPQAESVAGNEQTQRFAIDQLDGGWSTRSFPHLIAPNKLSVADNVVYYRDGLVSKRPGNIKYGGAGTTGSGVRSLAGARFYSGNPTTGKLIVHSGNQLYVGNDNTGALTAIMGSNVMSTSTPSTFTQMRDPDMSSGNAIGLITCDGSRIPYIYDGTHFVAFSTAAGFLPVGVNSGVSIKPKYCLNWGQHLVLAGDATDPQALYISDAQRPERFSGYAFQDSAGTNYIPYYPGGPDGLLGDITGLAFVGPILIIFHYSGIVACINTGTYGAFQYYFQTISSRVGATSPYSIVPFDTFVLFFGGDRFYATEGQTIQPFVDEIPTVYSNSARSAHPPLIKNINTVVGARRGTMYMASYDAVGNGQQTQMVTCDLAAGGGYQYGGNGGAWARWLGMNFNWGLECRGPGDTFQMYWGDSTKDQVYQYDAGTYDDNGTPISMEVRTKAFFFEKPASPKVLQGLYLMLVFDVQATQYTDSISPYAIFDQTQVPGSALAVTVAPNGTLYGTSDYGTFFYNSSTGVLQTTPKTYIQYPPRGLSVSFGFVENSKNPCNIIGFIPEATIDPPEN